jgi:hypothetical protein
LILFKDLSLGETLFQNYDLSLDEILIPFNNLSLGETLFQNYDLSLDEI